MNDLQIKEINKDNWEEAFEIKVRAEQTSFVPSITESLAYAYIKPWDEALDAYAIYLGKQIIGAFYLSYTPGSVDNYWIGGFQIDRNYQGKGYGKQSFMRIIRFVKEKHPACRVISLTVEKTNEQAIHLYEKIGFITEEKENQDGEQIYRMKMV